MQEIYSFICRINSKHIKGEKMNNTKLTKYLFGLGSFIIVFYLAINTNKENTQTILDQENIITEEHNLNQIDEEDFSVTKEKLKDLTDIPSVEDESFETGDNNTNYTDLVEDQKSIFVNNIKIAKQIDSDESSDSYREPISSYKTITTLDKNVTKTIDYYPEFYIWTSINTEFMDLNQKNQVADNQSEIINILQPAKLSMIVTCNENVISEFDYQINAKTPRWREWVKIDLTQFETESIMGKWNVQIVNQNNSQVLESRNFTFEKELDIEQIKQTAEIVN